MRNLIILAAIAGGAWYLYQKKTAAAAPVQPQADSLDWFDWTTYKVYLDEGVESLSDLTASAWDEITDFFGPDPTDELPISP